MDVTVSYSLPNRVKGKCSDASVVDASVNIARSMMSLPLAVTSSLGVLEKNCIFCKGPVHIPERLNLYPHVRLYNHRTVFSKLCKATWRPRFHL